MNWRAERAAKENAELPIRWEGRPHTSQDEYSDENSYGLERCDVSFINLAKRRDRRRQITVELKRIGISDFRRFEAIEDDYGALGCARSHREVVANLDPSRNRLSMICEDDCIFLEERDFIDKIVEEFALNPHLSVLALAYNAKNSLEISQTLAISSNTLTMCCYILKPHIVEPLLTCLNRSVELLAGGAPEGKGACDVQWKVIQRSHFLAIPIRRVAKQRPSYSNIRNRKVNYAV